MTAGLIEQKPLIEEYLKKSVRPTSSFSFVNIFAWRDFFQFEFKVIHKNLCIFATNELGTFLYLPPLGENVSTETVEECFHTMAEKNNGSGVSRIENVGEDLLHLFPEKKYRRTVKADEYCYYRKDIVELSGNPYKSKRWAYNHFIKNYPAVFLPYGPSLLEECMALYDDWAEGRREVYQDEVYRQMLDENRRVHELLLRHFDQLGLIGRVVKVNNEIKGYTFGFALSEDIFCVYSEITDLKSRGCAVYLFSEFCGDQALQQYKFINVMDDFALHNIEKTKRSFHPVLLFPSYVIQRD